MTRIIYSFYIDILEKDLDFFDKNILKKNQIPTNSTQRIHEPEGRYMTFSTKKCDIFL